MSERYYAKREAGLPAQRRDGSSTSPETDRQAAAAERFAAHVLGAEFNNQVYARHGDGGSDFTIKGRSVEVVWLGARGDAMPRLHGHLIINPEEPQRHADLYVVVAGSIESGFTLVGWATHMQLTSRPLRDFGYGPRYALPTGSLMWFQRHAFKREVQS